jgi:hypothetical protein
MGYGDEVIASGLARGAAIRGKRIAFGNGRRIVWTRQSHEIFRGNPNVAPPGSEGDRDIEWIKHFRGHRLYGELHQGHWRFRDFRCPPGEIYFDAQEHASIASWAVPRPIIIEPAVKPVGACIGANKQWPVDRYLAVADALAAEGEFPISVGPTSNQYGEHLTRVITPTFRGALTVMSLARLYIGPEGGLHHAAAALGIPAVVIFGGFNSPKATGYPWHSNIVAPGPPCGTVVSCKHCRDAMAAITVDRVLEAAVCELQRDDATRKQRRLM